MSKTNWIRINVTVNDTIASHRAEPRHCADLIDGTARRIIKRFLETLGG